MSSTMVALSEIAAAAFCLVRAKALLCTSSRSCFQCSRLALSIKAPGETFHFCASFLWLIPPPIYSARIASQFVDFTRFSSFPIVTTPFLRYLFVLVRIYTTFLDDFSQKVGLRHRVTKHPYKYIPPGRHVFSPFLDSASFSDISRL